MRIEYSSPDLFPGYEVTSGAHKVTLKRATAAITAATESGLGRSQG